ncbi:protein kinase C delta type-like [Bombina bombina]|uniref:protein kinase C delta type-like n=1 Tax=Bombina bombina TaxID=8345 RepID=UPI00235B186F|nr:protein kinase C delta type-like [Bombina bombina]
MSVVPPPVLYSATCSSCRCLFWVSLLPSSLSPVKALRPRREHLVSDAVWEQLVSSERRSCKRASFAGGSYDRPVRPQDKVPLSIGSLIYHQVLGRGCFGQVMLASTTSYSDLFAVKIVMKSEVIRKTKEQSLIELSVFQQAKNCAFLTQAYAAFQTKYHLYYIMEYLPGGSLQDHLNRNWLLSMESTRFYAAEISCGLQFLHDREIIHRDLKPDNILLDSRGHLKIADYGLATLSMNGQRWDRSFAGTPGYTAPEMFLRETYTCAVDWWSLGVITYEMATGVRPFRASTLKHLKWAVINDKPAYPTWLDHRTEDFIRMLLRKQPLRRLGVFGIIRWHPFFDGLDWVELEQHKVEPPFIPVVKPLGESPQPLPGADPANAWKLSILPEEQRIFEGFSYVCSKFAAK